MKKLIVLFFTVLFMLPSAGASPEGNAAETRRLVPREEYRIRTELKGDWSSEAPAVATVDEQGLVTAVSEGLAVIRLEKGGKPLLTFSVDVAADPEVPELVWSAIDLAIREWEAGLGSSFKKSNKYTTWYYGPKASFGWCGAFTSFSLGVAGIPQAETNTFRQVTPLPDGQPYGIREAGVPKLLTGFTNMDRITNIPRPGYLVIYGDRGGYQAKHVGLVTRVEDRGDGVYLLETAEGNLASRIKRLSYLYDSKTKDPARNILLLPETEQTNPDVFQYRLTSEDWRITAITQTWY